MQIKRISAVLLISLVFFSAEAAIPSAGRYILNPDGPTGEALIDTPYNLGKDLLITAEKFLFLPLEITLQFIINAI